MIVQTWMIVLFSRLKKIFPEKGAEHHPEFFTNDGSKCLEYMCKFSCISLDIYFHYWANLKPHFREHGMENVVGKHSNNETNQALTMCLLSTNVPQYKTSISFQMCKNLGDATCDFQYKIV